MGQLEIFQESPEGLSKPPGDKNTTKSRLGTSHSVSEGVPLCQTIFQTIQISSRFFGATLFAARIPFVSAAGAGDDFSNNLFTDLAPILALFGEQVVSPVVGVYIS